MAVSESKDAVRAFWEADPCAAKLGRSAFGTKAFYREVGAAKDELEPFRVPFAGFAGSSGLDVLEIGVGLGLDFVRFARAGARAVGVDLTEAAVDSTAMLLELEGLEAEVRTADAENLPFAAESFDVVYSWGVLHHTADTGRAIEEARRVLRAGGEARIMLYALDSPFAAAVWTRQVIRERRPLGLRAALARGLESPGTQAFTDDEVKRLFAGFSHLDHHRAVTPYDRRVLGPLAPLVGHGWHHLVTARR
jgi:SAM-dependent methyltransferase